MSTATTMKWNVKFTPHARGRKTLGLLKEEEPCPEQGRIPRVARLMALAIKFEGMIRDGVVKDYAELGRLGKVTRARISQIMSLLNLAPDIQEAVLFLPRVEMGREPLKMRGLLKLVVMSSWESQRNAVSTYQESSDFGKWNSSTARCTCFPGSSFILNTKE